MVVTPDWDVPLVSEIQNRKNDLFYLSGTLIEPVKTANRCVISPFDYGRDPSSFRESEFLHDFVSFDHPDWNGASWPPSIVSRRLWDLVNGYSEEFSPGMYSDPDFSMKLWKAGVRDFLGVSQCRIYHFMSKSVSKLAVKNDGRKKFLLKWAISPSAFYRHYLRISSPYVSPLKEPSLSAGYLWDLFRNTIQRLFLVMQS
jgi:hypothetical protein